jgi:hypothetical protein
MLQLAALDEGDLEIISAMVQDSVLKVGDIQRIGASAFSLTINRFAWDVKAKQRDGTGERRRSVLQFTRVKSVATSGIDRGKPDTILSLLAVQFTPAKLAADAPAGLVTLVFSAGAAIQLQVECIECRLVDSGAAWSALATPAHSV